MEKIIIDYENIKSIERAEKKKAQLENKGLNLIRTEQNGFNRFNLVYA